jgi:hypothetical protein
MAVAPPVRVTVAPLPSEEGEMVPEILHDPDVRANEKVFETPPALAVRTAVWAVVTAATVAVKPTLVDDDGIVTVAGTLTLVFPLASVTGNPPAGAAALSVTVQAATPGGAMLAGVQDNPLKTVVEFATAVKLFAVTFAPLTVTARLAGVKV